MDQNNHENNKKVVKNALAMTFGTMSSRVLGLLRDMAFAALFTPFVTDAWAAAWRLPNLFRRLLGEGSLSVCFIPVFVDAKADNAKRAQNLVNGVFSGLLIILSMLTVLGTIYAREILTFVLDEKYILLGAKFELTVRLAQIMFCFIFFISYYAFFMSILNAMGKFALAALAPCFFNVAMIISTFIPQDFFTTAGDGIAWGVVVGGFLQMAVLIPAVRKYEFLPKLDITNLFNNPDVKKVFTNLLPGLFGMSLLQFTTIINLYFVSQLAEGSVSYIYFADRLLELPLSLVSVSLGTALLPMLASLREKGEVGKMIETTFYHLRLNLFISTAAAVGLFMLADNIVIVLFKKGLFSSESARITANILKIYSLTLLSMSCVRVLAPAYYAVKNTWVPSVVSAVSLVLHVIVAPIMMAKWEIYGLVASSTITATINIVLLLVLYPFFIGKIPVLSMIKSIIKFGVVGAGMVIALLNQQLIRASIGEFFGLIINIAIGVGVFVAVSRALELEEFNTTFGVMINKFKRKFGPVK